MRQLEKKMNDKEHLLLFYKCILSLSRLSPSALDLFDFLLMCNEYLS